MNNFVVDSVISKQVSTIIFCRSCQCYAIKFKIDKIPGDQSEEGIMTMKGNTIVFEKREVLRREWKISREKSTRCPESARYDGEELGNDDGPDYDWNTKIKRKLVPQVRCSMPEKNTPSRGPISKPHYLPHPWTCPNYDAKRHPDPIHCFSTMHWTDRPTDRRTDRPTDRSRENLMTIGRCAMRATQPNNTRCIVLFVVLQLCKLRQQDRTRPTGDAAQF